MSENSVPRTARDRLRARLDRLDELASNDYEARVRETLSAFWSGHRAPETLRLRPQFVALDRPYAGDILGERLPPVAQRPPSGRIVMHAGVAQRLYLTALFVGQCVAPPGRTPPARPVGPTAEPTVVPWVHLVAAQVAAPRATVRVSGSTANRIRQLTDALARLAQPEIALVHLPMGDRRTAGRFRDWQLLMETGHVGRPTPEPYIVPPANTATISVPAAFMLRGWVTALSPSEISIYLALRHLAQLNTEAHDTHGVFLDGETRLRRYGLSRDAYGATGLLERLGLIVIERDPERRDDGTIEYDPYDPPAFNRFRLTDSGLDNDACDRVIATLSTP